MTDIVLNDGLVAHTFATSVGTHTLTYNPTDVNFLEALYATAEALDRKQDEYRAEKDRITSDPKEIFKFAHRIDDEMREILDGFLGDNACKSMFGSINLTARRSDGLPLGIGVLFTLVDTMSDSIDEADKKAKARMDKYVKKYHR